MFILVLCIVLWLSFLYQSQETHHEVCRYINKYTYFFLSLLLFHYKQTTLSLHICYLYSDDALCTHPHHSPTTFLPFSVPPPPPPPPQPKQPTRQKRNNMTQLLSPSHLSSARPKRKSFVLI